MADQVKEDVKQAWWWAAENRSKRLDYLRKAAWSKGTLGGDFLEGFEVSLEKLRWYSKVFWETDGEPWVLRRAKALAATLENMPIFIVDNSQIVGYPADRPNRLLIHPDVSYLINDDIMYDRKKFIHEEDVPWVKKALTWWRPRSIASQCERYLSSEELKIGKLGIILAGSFFIDGCNSAQVDYDFVLENGVGKVIKTIEDNLAEAQKQLSSGPATPDTYPLVRKMDQWNAMLISARALVEWARRYSRLARIVADNYETDSKRKAELLRLSDVCAKVPEHPPEHLQEAIQAQHFVGMSHKYIEQQLVGYGMCPDQLWWPHYKKDVIDDGVLTKEQVLDLLGEWQIRVWESTSLLPRAYRVYAQGAPASLPVVTIGGTRPEDGRDACNDLTEALLEAARLTRVSMPSFCFKYHPQARLSTVKAVFETIRHGLGYPSIQHNQICIDTLMNSFGATLEEARSWANVVCMSPCPTKGRGGQAIRYASAQLIGSKAVELALYNGYDAALTGIRGGPQTGDPSKFTSFEEFWEAWRTQLGNALQFGARIRNINRFVESDWNQASLASCFWQRCVDMGVDCKDARSEPLGNPWITVVAWNDTGDSLYAIKKLVYDEKKYTMEQLLEALKANWDGYEDMRMDFVNVPKFGNDIEEVDEFVAQTFAVLSEEARRNVEWGGARFMVLPENGAGFVACASRVGPLTNGRRYPDPLYDGGSSPGAGMDRKGPTAVLRSCAKIDGRRLKQVLLNQRFSGSQLSGEKGFQLWHNYMKAWYDMEIPHVQFNMVDTETLREAQQKPEEYAELVIRVAGYSALFTEMNRMTQDAIIGRTLEEL